MLLLASCLPIVFGACQEEGTVVVHKIAFNGVRSVDEARLKSSLATRQSAPLPWGRKYFFDKARFEADLQRVQAFYADRGFPEARVTSFDAKLNDKQDAVDVTVTIDEGEPVRVAAIHFVGFEVIPPNHVDTLERNIPVKVNKPRDRQDVAVAHDQALNELRDHGYPYAKVSTDEMVVERSVTLTFTAEPGVLAHFGPIEIVGNTAVSDRVIRRQLTFKPGELYRRSIVQDAQRRLYAMELFLFVNIEAVDPERQEPEIRTRVTIAEGKHQRVNLGVGYGTEEKGRVEGEYHHVNFLGGGRSAGAHARWSGRLDRGIRLDFVQPYLFTPHFSLSGEGQQWYTFLPAFNSVTTGTKLALTHRQSQRTSWSISLTDERDRSEISPQAANDPRLRNDLIASGLNPDSLKQSGTLHAAGFDLQHSTADNVLNARRGYQLAFHTEAAGKLLPGTFNYVSASADGRHYLPIGSRLVLANRLQLGSLDAAGNHPGNVPFSKKYFLGGASSIRGWGRYEVSPLGTSGFPIGGSSEVAFSSELRAALRGALGGVVFVDGGNVWKEEWKVDLSDLRYAVGLGLRYQTRVGPARFDYGYQLNPIDGLLVNGKEQARRWRVHFSIGQAF